MHNVNKILDSIIERSALVKANHNEMGAWAIKVEADEMKDDIEKAEAGFIAGEEKLEMAILAYRYVQDIAEYHKGGLTQM